MKGYLVIYAARHSLFVAVRSCDLNVFKRGRPEESEAVDLPCFLERGDACFQLVDLVFVGGLQISVQRSLRV